MTLAVAPQQGYVENLVTIPNTAALENVGTMPTDAKAFLFFGSLVHEAGDARTALVSWDGTDGRIYSLMNSDGAGTSGVAAQVRGTDGRSAPGEVKPARLAARIR